MKLPYLLAIASACTNADTNTYTHCSNKNYNIKDTSSTYLHKSVRISFLQIAALEFRTESILSAVCSIRSANVWYIHTHTQVKQRVQMESCRHLCPRCPTIGFPLPCRNPSAFALWNPRTWKKSQNAAYIDTYTGGLTADDKRVQEGENTMEAAITAERGGECTKIWICEEHAADEIIEEHVPIKGWGFKWAGWAAGAGPERFVAASWAHDKIRMSSLINLRLWIFHCDECADATEMHFRL